MFEAEVVPMGGSTRDPARERAERFGRLPERIRLEDTVTTQDAGAAPDPTMGRNIEQDAALHAGG